MDDFDDIQYEELYDRDHCLCCGESLESCHCYEHETSLVVVFYDDDDLPF